jgi:hypothetical protein
VPLHLGAATADANDVEQIGPQIDVQVAGTKLARQSLLDQADDAIAQLAPSPAHAGPQPPELDGLERAQP